MIRNLLYSICLHLIFVLFMLFSDRINNILSDKVVSINGLNVESDFLEKNDIKITDKNVYSNLTLNEKIELYELAKETHDKNKKFTEFDVVSLKNKLKTYKSTENTSIENNVNYTNSINTKFNTDEILYLGPTDYNNLLAKLEEKRKKREQNKQMEKEKEDKNKIELTKEIEVIKKEKYNKKTRGTSNQLNINRENKDKKEIKIEENVASKNSENYLDPNKHIQVAKNTNDRDITKNIESSDVKIIENNIKKNQIIDKRITEILNKNLANNKEIKEQVEIKKEKNEKIEQFNIDIDKIFTKDDIKDIKKHIRKEVLGDLTLREKVNIQNQIIMCYKSAILQTKKNNKVKVSVTLKLFQDGIIDTKKINIKIIDDKNKFNENDYKDAIENIKLALAYCNPLRNLPLIKYQSWQHINFIFDTTVE